MFKYTVIIPHYNAESELELLLSSIPNRKDIEIIVIDDRSDSSEFIKTINKSQHDNITYYINKGIKGAGSARNIGIEKSKGDFLIFADSDDFFTSRAFDFIDQEVAEEDIDIYFFKATSIDENGNTGFRHLKKEYLINNYLKRSGKYYNEKLLFNNHGPCAKIYSRDFIINNSIIFGDTIVANDGLFTFKSAKNAKNIKVSNKVIYCITQRENSLTTTKNVSNYRTRLEVFVKCYHLLSEEEIKRSGMSPIPILLTSKKYGYHEVVKSTLFLKKNRIPLLKNFPLNTDKVHSFLIRNLRKPSNSKR